MILSEKDIVKDRQESLIFVFIAFFLKKSEISA